MVPQEGENADAAGEFRIQTWALEEARRRLEAEGIIEDSTKPQPNRLRTVSGLGPKSS